MLQEGKCMISDYWRLMLYHIRAYDTLLYNAGIESPLTAVVLWCHTSLSHPTLNFRRSASDKHKSLCLTPFSPQPPQGFGNTKLVNALLGLKQAFGVLRTLFVCFAFGFGIVRSGVERGAWTSYRGLVGIGILDETDCGVVVVCVDDEFVTLRQCAGVGSCLSWKELRFPNLDFVVARAAKPSCMVTTSAIAYTVNEFFRLSSYHALTSSTSNMKSRIHDTAHPS
jgi:hypothetical protein